MSFFAISRKRENLRHFSRCFPVGKEAGRLSPKPLTFNNFPREMHRDECPTFPVFPPFPPLKGGSGTEGVGQNWEGVGA